MHGASGRRSTLPGISAEGGPKRGIEAIGVDGVHPQFILTAQSNAQSPLFSFPGCQIDTLPPGVHTTRSPPLLTISHASYSASGSTERLIPSAKCTSRRPFLHACTAVTVLPTVARTGPRAVGCSGDKSWSVPCSLKMKDPSMRIVVVLSLSHNSIPKALSTKQRVTIFPWRGTNQ